MSSEEAEHTIASLRAEIDALRDRVTDLELRVAGGHNCLIDLCDMDANGRCRLRPCDHPEEEA
jgi:hypothetical protein